MILILHSINFPIYSNKNNLILNRLQNQFQTQNIKITILRRMFNKFNLKVKINFSMKF